jgi:hypothetical protein
VQHDPVTQRKQLNLIPESTMLSAGRAAVQGVLKEHPPSADQEDRAREARGRDIQRAVEQYFAASGLSHELEGYKWETNLVESKEVNAWCMPGGIVVYRILRSGQAGLAVVIG